MLFAHSQDAASDRTVFPSLVVHVSCKMLISGLNINEWRCPLWNKIVLNSNWLSSTKFQLIFLAQGPVSTHFFLFLWYRGVLTVPSTKLWKPPGTQMGPHTVQLTSLMVKRQNFILAISRSLEKNAIPCNYRSLWPCFQCTKARLVQTKEQLQPLRILQSEQHLVRSWHFTVKQRHGED